VLIDTLRAHSLRSLLMAGAAVSVLAIAQAPVAMAQDQTDEQTEEEDEDEETRSEDKITVTGSRVRRDEFNTASPIQVIDGELSRDLGQTDASEILSSTTVVQGQQVDTGLSTSANVATNSGPGSANVSLRGLQVGRTLVLVNGRRLAPAGVRGAPSAPDLNQIPGTMIERIEILLDGASSIYGSDALAGVTNIILRNDFDGVELDAFYSQPEIGEGVEQVYSATWGVNNDRGFIGFSANYTQANEITTREWRDFYDYGDSRSDTCVDMTVTRDSRGKYFYDCGGALGGGVAITPFGFFIQTPGTTIPNGFGFGINDFQPLSVTLDLLIPGSANNELAIFNEEAFNETYSPTFRRFNIFSVGEYDLGILANMTAYYEGSYTFREVSNLSFSQGSLDIPDYYVGNTSFGSPFTATGVETFEIIHTRQLDVRTEVDQARVVLGVRGDLPILNNFLTLDDWTYDIYGSYSRSKGYDRVFGAPMNDRVQQILETGAFNPVTGEFFCEPVELDPANGPLTNLTPLPCSYADFLDPTFLQTGRFANKASNEYVFENRTTYTTVQQTVLNGFATGTLFQHDAGPVQAVIGAEFRDDKIDTETDRSAQSAENVGFFQDRGTNGSRSLAEVFFELDVPVLRDLPFANSLDLNFAARYTEEEFFGSYWTYRLQGLYSPVDWFTLRATYGTSFRAPDLNETFGDSALFFGTVADICEVPALAIVTVPNPANPAEIIQTYDPTLDPRDPQVLANCANGGGVGNLLPVDPTSLGTQGLGTPNVVFTGGSPLIATGPGDLDPETSRAFTAGFVFEQPWFDNFDFRLSATYFDITVQGQVTTLGAQTVVNTCYNSPGLSDGLCTLITRDPASGFYSLVESPTINRGDLTAVGVDINVQAGFDFSVPTLDSPFRIDGFLTATRNLENDDELLDTVDQNLGEFGFPRWRATATGILGWQDFQFLWRSRFIDNMRTDTTFTATSALFECNQVGTGTCTFVDDTPHYFVHDAAVTYAADTWRFRAGVNNVFNERPPLLDVATSRSDIRGVGYDLIGRTYFVNVTKAF